MLVFISGGVRSGKSLLAEKLAASLAGENRKIYLATARHYDEEIRQRIQVHQANRAGKGFITIDKSWDIGEAADILGAEDTVLVDCLGTLLANEMFERTMIDKSEGLKESIMGQSSLEIIKLDLNSLEICEKIIADLIADLYDIRDQVSNLIVVSNEVFSDGILYPEETENYIWALARLHIKIAELADAAVECVYSEYQCHKGRIDLFLPAKSMWN